MIHKIKPGFQSGYGINYRWKPFLVYLLVPVWRSKNHVEFSYLNFRQGRGTWVKTLFLAWGVKTRKVFFEWIPTKNVTWEDLP